MRPVWRIHSKHHLLIAQIYRGDYGTHSPINVAYYDCTEHNVLWGHLRLARPASKLKEGLRWQIWNGCTVRVRKDRW